MLFRKRRRKENIPPQVRQGCAHSPTSGKENFIRIEFDMMKKGSLTKRDGHPIRQCCVMVGGTSTLVTSGDLVDSKTYRALVENGFIEELPENNPVPGDNSVLGDTNDSHIEKGVSG